MIASTQLDDLTPESRAIEGLLAAHADALVRKPSVAPDNFDFLFDEYHLNATESTEARGLISVAHRLNNLTPVAPSEAFIQQLKSDLVGTHAESALILRWRRLPPFYRVAASVGGMTLTAGILLLASRRVIDVIMLRRQAKKGFTLNTAS
jgi:hypothetical protein